MIRSFLWALMFVFPGVLSAQVTLFKSGFEITDPGVGADPQQQAAAFLQRATFGPKMLEIDDVVNRGFEDWLQSQFAAEPTLLLPQLLAVIPPGEDPFDAPALRNGIWWKTILNSDDQLRQRVAFALSQVLVISDTNDRLEDVPTGVADFYDVLVRNALGNYRDILLEVSRHPAMGFYLSHIGNQKADPARNIRPDENYAREIMQLFSIGLVMLNPDGTTVIGSDGMPIPTYGQNDVKEMAKVFTGWNYADTPCEDFEDPPNDDNFTTPMTACHDFHETAEKTVLGQTIGAGGTAEQDLQAAVNILFNHPNTGPFVVNRLIQRLVTSNPTPGYVQRAAAVFDDNGQGERGDLQAVVQAILLDAEAMNGHNTLENFGALREPLLRISHLFRTFGGVAVTGDFSDGGYSVYPEGQRAQSSPSVFNFFAPDYTPPGPLDQLNLLAPEFRLESDDLHNVNSNHLDMAARFFVTGTEQEEDWLAEPVEELNGLVTINYDAEVLLRNDTNALMQRLDLLLTAGRMPTAMFNALKNDLDAMLAESDGRMGDIQAVAETVNQIVQSPAYLIQR